MIEIKQTRYEDLENVRCLWADGEVMKFVGFPEGIIETEEAMHAWLERSIAARPSADHYSVYENGAFCGEASYDIDEAHKAASLDIKLFAFARGRGIAAKALSHAIAEAFKNGANTVWVDPNPENTKALALYERLGFVKKPMPDFVIEMGEDPNENIYMELCKANYKGETKMENRKITLREINTRNLEDVLELKPTEEQKNFVASNMFSLAEAYAVNASGRYAKPLAIYADDDPVGFLMIGYDFKNDYDEEEDDEELPYYVEKSYLFWRFMIDKEHQGKGYGRAALALALDFIRSFPAGEAAYCWLSYEPENEVARKLYASFGFEEKELPEGWDEIPAVLKL